MSRPRRQHKSTFYSDEEYEEIESPRSSKPRSGGIGRNDNSLGVLTRKFVGLIQSAENQCIDLNEAVKVLNVQKRRIYDITNVLEGIGLVHKKFKNKIQWVGSTEETEVSDISQELQALIEEEEALEYWTNYVQDSLVQLTRGTDYTENAYVTYDDIRQLPKFIDADNETLIAIQAPPGSNLEVPDPDSFPPEETQKYQICLQSETGKILVYVASNEQIEGELAKQNVFEAKNDTNLFP